MCPAVKARKRGEHVFLGKERKESLFPVKGHMLQLPELPSFYLICSAEKNKPTVLYMSSVGRHRSETTNPERNLDGNLSFYFLACFLYPGPQLQKYIVRNGPGQCNHTKAIENKIKLISYPASTMEKGESEIPRA